MPTFHIDSPGAVGIITDQPAQLLPPEGWSDGRNMRFSKGNAYSRQASKLIADAPSDFVPYWILPCRTDTDLFQLVMGLSKSYAFSANSFSEVTQDSFAYTGGVDDRWNGGIL